VDKQPLSRSTATNYLFYPVSNLWISRQRQLIRVAQTSSTHNSHRNIHSYPQVTPNLGATINFLFSFKVFMGVLSHFKLFSFI